MRLRLLKVIVQPFFVEDDGTNLTEQPAQPIVVASGEWEDFVQRFPELVAAAAADHEHPAAKDGE